MRGTVKWFSDDKGYGFITGEDGVDAFVHINTVPEDVTLSEGVRVQFEREEGKKGPRVKTLSLLAMLLLAGCMAILSLACPAALAQTTAPAVATSQPAAPVAMIDFSAVLGSPAAIVALTMLLVQVIKKNAPGWGPLASVPIWLYALAVSAVLTLLAVLGLHSISGGVWPLLANICANALLSLGGYGFLAGLTKTPATSAGIDPQKSGGSSGSGGWPSSLCLVLLAAAACSLCSCASPTIDSWAARGTLGLDSERVNQRMLFDRVAEALDKAEDAAITAAMADVVEAAAGKLLDPNGQAIKADAAWAAEHANGLRLAMRIQRSKRLELDAQKEIASRNLDQIAEAFTQIRRLRASSIGADSEQLASQVSQLTQLVQGMISSQKTTSGK